MPCLNTSVYCGPQNELLVNWSYWKQLLLAAIFLSVVISVIFPPLFPETTSILVTMIYNFYHQERLKQCADWLSYSPEKTTKAGLNHHFKSSLCNLLEYMCSFRQSNQLTVASSVWSVIWIMFPLSWRPGKSCSLLVSGFCLEADCNLCTFNLGQLGLGEQPLISMTRFSGGTSRPNNTCIRALTHVSQLWVVLLLLCPTVHIMSLREEVREP